MISFEFIPYTIHLAKYPISEPPENIGKLNIFLKKLTDKS